MHLRTLRDSWELLGIDLKRSDTAHQRMDEYRLGSHSTGASRGFIVPCAHPSARDDTPKFPRGRDGKPAHSPAFDTIARIRSNRSDLLSDVSDDSAPRVETCPADAQSALTLGSWA
jgi:hypothetical protein